MAIVYTEGFDVYSTTVNKSARRWSNTSGSFVTGRWGGQALQLTATGNQNSQLTLPSALSQGCISFAFNPSSVASIPGGGQAKLRLQAAGTAILCFGINGNGQLFIGGAYVSTFSSYYIAPTNFMSESEWAFIEIEFVRHASAGEVRLWKNGVQIGSATGLALGSVDVDSLYFGQTSGQNGTVVFDDVIVDDSATSHKNDARIKTLLPSSDDSKQWTPSTGTNNAALVDDATINGDTDYVSSSTSGHRDIYNMSDLSMAGTPTVLAVTTCVAHRKDDAASWSVKPIIKSNTVTDTAAAAQASTSTYAIAEYLRLTDPNTSAAWTAAAVDALKAGMDLI